MPPKKMFKMDDGRDMSARDIGKEINIDKTRIYQCMFNNPVKSRNIAWLKSHMSKNHLRDAATLTDPNSGYTGTMSEWEKMTGICNSALHQARRRAIKDGFCLFTTKPNPQKHDTAHVALYKYSQSFSAWNMFLSAPARFSGQHLAYA